MQLFRRFLIQKGGCFRGKMDPVFFYDCFGLLAGAVIRISRSAGNAVQGIADHVAQHDAQHFGRSAGLGKPSCLHAAETFADLVQFYNIRAAVQELQRNLLQLVARDQRQFKQCAAAAGNQKNHRIFRLQPLHHFQRFFCRSKTVLIRDRMTGFAAFYIGDFSLYMFIFGDYDTAVDLPQRIHSRFRHLPGSLSDSHQDLTARVELIIFQRAPHRFVRLHRLNGSVYNFFRFRA